MDRPRVIGDLTAASTMMLGLIAPAGYGKSSAAAEFGRSSGRPLAWLSLDARDGDPATFVRGISAAIDAAVTLDPAVIDRVADPGASPWSVAVPALAAALSRLPPLTIVVDDVDRIGTDEAIDVLLGLSASLAAGSRLVVTGRSLGRLAGPRLQAGDVMTVFGRESLALERDEVAEILAASGMGSDRLDPSDIRDRTEGWAAGVYLASLATRGAGAPDGRPTAVSPTAPERQIEEYLRTEVLAAMDPVDADLLLRASVVDRWSGPLCDAMLERTGSGAALDRLERTNLFLIPLDAERTWYRPHQLLGEVFRAEMERRSPEQVRALVRRAAQWYVDQDQPEPALECAFAAEDEVMAATLVARIAQVTLNAGRQETVRRWLAWFDDREVVLRMPRFVALATLAFSLDGDVARTDRWAARLRPYPTGDGASADGVDADVGGQAVARGCLLREGVSGIAAEADLAVASLPDDDPLATGAWVALGLAHHLRGETAEAVTAFETTIERWGGDPARNLGIVIALVHLAVIDLERGDRASAEARIRRARSTLISHGMVEQPIAGAVDALDARLAMAHGAVDQARQILGHAQRLRPMTGVTAPWLGMRMRLDLVRVLLAMGDGGGARTIMAEVHDIIRERPDLGTLIDEARTLDERLATVRGGVAGATTLTLAELRLLPLLTTHLSFREIGERLFVSQNTVKTQAISIYRKLDATSRSEAVERATQLGLLGVAPRERFIPAG